jgi:hypothetical protein
MASGSLILIPPFLATALGRAGGVGSIQPICSLNFFILVRCSFFCSGGNANTKKQTDAKQKIIESGFTWMEEL